MTTTRTPYIDGLRGVAALIVQNQHFMNTFYAFLAAGAEWSSVYKYSDAYHPLRATPLRIIFAGTWPVTLFYIISGFTLALSIQKMYAAGKKFDAYERLRAAWLKRYVRLAAPLLAISWLYHVVYRTGGFQIADTVSVTTASNWLSRYSLVWDPDGEKHWAAYRIDILSIPYFLYETLVSVFVFQSPSYAVQFWPISVFFAGSIVVFGILFSVAPLDTKPRWIVYAIIIVGMFVPPWMGGMARSTLIATGVLGLFVVGLIVADLHINGALEKIPRIVKIIASPGLAYLVIYMGSYPQVFPERVMPEYWQALISNEAIKRTGYVYPYTIASTAMLLLCLISPPVQYVLSNRALVYLGTISYEIYLIHCLFMFTTVPLVFSWLSYGGAPYDVAAIMAYIINIPIIIVAAALAHNLVTKPTENLIAEFSFKPTRETLLKYLLLVASFLVAMFAPINSPPGGCLLPFYRAQLGTQSRIYNWFTTTPTQNPALKQQANFMYIMRNDYPIVSDRIRPFYEHYTCGNNGSMIITTDPYFDYTVMSDWHSGCVGTSVHTGYILTPRTADIAPLFLADDETQSNLKPLYLCVLPYLGKIQDSFISTTQSSNEAYKCQNMGYAWVVPQIGGTPTPCIRPPGKN